MAPAGRRVTIRDVARAAGVSVATVSPSTACPASSSSWVQASGTSL
jgi:hypothetical protein